MNTAPLAELSGNLPTTPTGATSQTHFVVVTMGTAGDMYPFLSLSKALLGKGHRVTFLAPAIHEHLAQQAGVPFCPLTTREEYLATFNDPDIWNPEMAFTLVWRNIRRNVPRIRKFIESLPRDERCILLVKHLVLPAAALAVATRKDIRIVGVYLSPENLRTCHDPLTIGSRQIPRWFPMHLRRWLWARIDTKKIDIVAVPELNAERESQGLPPVTHFTEHMHAVADLSITLFPDWFAKRQPDWPSPLHSGQFPLYEPNPDQALVPELTRFLAAGEPPIVFTLGTGHRHAASYFGVALQVVQRLGYRAIFLTIFSEQVPPDLPGNILWQKYVPLHALLPHVSAFVHHGGIGTTAEALRAGVPQLVAPVAHDQFDNAARVCALGVGSALPASRLDVGNLSGALHTLLASNEIRARCGTVAARFSESDGTDALFSVIESIT